MLDIDSTVERGGGEVSYWGLSTSTLEASVVDTTKSFEREMLQDVIAPALPPPPMEDFCIDGISTLEFCDDTDFFLDSLDSDLPSFSPTGGACSASATTSASTATSSSTTTVTTGGGEGPCCYVDDNAASFAFDPAAISALLSCQHPYESNQLDIVPRAAAAAGYQLPLAPVYDVQDHQFQQPMCADVASGGFYSSFGAPGRQLAPEYGEYLAAPVSGYAGLDSFLDAPAANGYYPADAMGMGFFSKAMMVGLEPEMAADGGAVAMPEAVQRAYSSGDMQMMGDCQNQLVGGGGSNAKPLPTSDISALDNVCRLTAEQRKEKIHRYLKKRNERNFSKKIKYACRKTLADNRPRVRGRFAKNDELGEAKTRACSNNHEYDEYEVGMKEDQDVLSPDPSAYQWCDLLEIQLQS